MKRFRYVIASTLLIGILIMVMALRPTRGGEAQPTPMPIVLRQVQDLGELHTVRYTYQNVFQHRTSREPEQWTRFVPGLSGFVQASTRNEALVGVTGTVEAGVDLSKADWDSEGRLVLPQPTLYRPHIDAKLHSYKPGMFWADSNIALKAVSASEDRVREAAVRQGILVQARENVRSQISALVPGIAEREIVFALD